MSNELHLHPTRKRTAGAKRELAKKNFLSSLASAISRAESETNGVGTVTAILKYDSTGDRYRIPTKS